MNLRNRILAIVGAFMLVGGAAVSNVAQAAVEDTGVASVTITMNGLNALAVTIADATFASKPYSFATQTSTGTLDLDASDNRGTEAGWKINLGATDFESGTSPDVIPSTNLALAAGTVTASAGNTDGISTAAVPAVQTTPGASQIAAASATNGAGIYDISIGGTLTIPGGTLVASYTSTVEVSIVSGP